MMVGIHGLPYRQTPLTPQLYASTKNELNIEFDTAKNEANVAKHGASLSFGADVLLDEDRIVIASHRPIDGEDRSKVVGVKGELWTVVYVQRGRCFASFQCAGVTMVKNERIALKADPDDPEDFDVTEEALDDALADREARRRGRPAGSGKEQVSLRIDKDVLARFRAGGPGWQTRINEALKRVEAG